MNRIQLFFSGQPEVAQSGDHTYHLHSNLTGVLNDARTNTGRDGSGAVIHQDRAGNWLGNLGYLTLIDLLATCFFDTSSLPLGDRTKNSKVYPAFLVSHGFSEDEAQTIYALRCSFAHEYGLANVQRKLWFSLRADTTTATVAQAQQAWDGDWANLSPQNETRINLQSLAQRIEDIVSSLKGQADAGTLNLQLTAQEFEKRFFFWVGPL